MTSSGGLTLRPVQTSDVDLLVAMHGRLSTTSLYNRYHLPRVPTRQEIEQVCQLDGMNGAAIVAVLPAKEQQIVGLGYYLVTGEATAETAFVVEDSYQGLGIGRQLLRELIKVARKAGVRFFDAYVLPSNRPMMRLLTHAGSVIYNRIDYGAREIRVQIPKMSQPL
ncbi:MAG: GNAT family N-acetyltransferase [Candidatus Promineifilaceae bacterium]